MSYRSTGSLEDLFATEVGLEALAQAIAERVGDRLHELVTEFSPVSDDPFREFPGRVPGTLKRSWETGEVEVISIGRLRVTVETQDPVAPHVEWDTSPHIIRPKRAGGVLRFYDRQTGEVIFASEVHHPGTKGQHMMARALDALEAEWEVIANEEWAKWERSRVG